MDVTILSTFYLGTRQVNLREVRNVRTPTDLKGVKLRMPGSKEWLFLGEALGATAFDSPYAAAKAGVVGLTRAMAVELGREGICVNCVCRNGSPTSKCRVGDYSSDQHDGETRHANCWAGCNTKN
jgi:NAD(P)-dependent dehydrogenase (short-subunit alcohol dehydrogenase family)